MLIIMFLGGVIWIGSHQLDPFRPLDVDAPRRIEVQVVSLDWKWLFIYPRAGRRHRQPAGRAGGRAGALLAHLGERDERLLRAATGQHDRHHERHGHAAQPAGRPARRLLRPVRRISAATASPTCTSTCARAAPPNFAAWANAARGAGPVLDRRRLRAARAAEPATCRRSPTARVEPRLFHAIVTQRHPAGARAPTRQRRACRPRSLDRGRALTMFGKLTWSAIPWDQPIPLVTRRDR